MKTSHNSRKIRVCHIITKMVYGGASLGTLHLVECLDSARFERTVICGTQSEAEGSLLNQAGNWEFNVITISELVREINPIKDLRTFLKLMTIIKKNRYDVIHTHGSKAGVIGRLAAALSRVPIILHTVHGWGLKVGGLITRTLYRSIERLLASFTTRILFQTESDMNESYIYKIGRQSQYILIGNGIKLAPFVNYSRRIAMEIKNELRIGNNKVVGTVGRVSTQKNPIGFIDIAQKVTRDKGDVVFLFGGGGEMLGKMQERVRKLHLENKVIFLGVRKDIPELISTFDIFILPSRWEGMPRSIIEAMAAAKSVIVYDISGIHEIVDDGLNGFIVPMNDTAHFAEKIIFLLNNPQLRQKMSRISKSMARKFDFDSVVKKTESLYLELSEDIQK